MNGYSDSIKQTIDSMSKSIDLMMDSSMDLLMQADFDARDRIREVSSRLVNEVIVLEGQQSEEAAKDKLFELGKEIFALEALFKGYGVPLKGLPAVATTGEAVVPKAQAERLLKDFKDAFELQSNIVERWQKARPLLSSMAWVPVVGPLFTALIGKQDARVQELDKEVIPVSEAFKLLERDFLPTATESVSIARNAWDRMLRFVASVGTTDEGLKRIEGIVFKKPASVAGMSTGQKVVVYGGGGIVALALLYWLGSEVL